MKTVGEKKQNTHIYKIYILCCTRLNPGIRASRYNNFN